MNPVKLDGVRALIVTDMHQDTNFFQEAIDREEGNFEYIIFNGDWFDSFYAPPKVAGIKDTCRFINSLFDEYGDKLLVNCGNHDISYYYDWYRSRGKCKYRNPFICSGYTGSKSEKIARNLDERVIENTHLAMSVNGFLISHAGVLPNLISYSVGKNEEWLDPFLKKTEDVWANFRYESDNPLFGCGAARGGLNPYSGLIWCDWFYEFHDSLGVPQIVGHTYNQNAYLKGSCYNLDRSQSMYGLLTPGGLEIKELEEK